MTNAPALLTLKEAADQIGRAKQTVLRAIQSGRISAEKDGNGEWRIQAVELFRVYPPGARDGADAPAMARDVSGEVVAAYREKLEMAEALHERERRQFEDTIGDLRRRLDAAEQERREKDAQLRALLTDQRVREPEATPAAPSRGFWRRLLGKPV